MDFHAIMALFRSASWISIVSGCFGACVGAYYLGRWLKAFHYKHLLSQSERAKRREAFLKGKVVVIIGASSGLGRALAKVAFTAGANVILAARSLDKLRGVCREVIDAETSRTSSTPVNECHYRYLDLADPNGIEEAVADIFSIYKRIDVLINNAGASFRGSILNTEIAVHRQLMEVNYFGHIRVTKAFLDKLFDTGCSSIAGSSGILQTRKTAPSLSIVGISSVQGRISLPYRSAYSASKHAYQAYFDCLRAELAKTGVRVLVVSPGYIRTNLSLNALTAVAGEKYGKMDETTRKGMDPNVAAAKICDALVQGKEELLLMDDMKPRFGILLRILAPSVYFWLMSKRARMEEPQ